MKLNVGQLIDKLQEFPRDTPVVMATDEEGNHYYPVGEVFLDRFTWEKHKTIFLWPTGPEVPSPYDI